MGYFYFARHGQTVWNVENKICGATDIELTEKGHEQAKELGEEILKQEIHIDEILYSPLVRAADTAKHVSEITGIPARMEPRLKEQNFGKYESTPRNGEEFKRAKQDFVCRIGKSRSEDVQGMGRSLRKRRRVSLILMKVENPCFIFAREFII